MRFSNKGRQRQENFRKKEAENYLKWLILHDFFRLLIFFQNQLFLQKKIVSDCHTVCNQIRTGTRSGTTFCWRYVPVCLFLFLFCFYFCCCFFFSFALYIYLNTRLSLQGYIKSTYLLVRKTNHGYRDFYKDSAKWASYDVIQSKQVLIYSVIGRKRFL